MSVSGPSPLGTLMVQRVEAALGVTLSQQANLATGARPDAVTQPGQPDKIDPIKNPPPKEQEGVRRGADQGGRQAGLAALARNDPEIAKLLAVRNAPMTGFTASAPTILGQAAKTILALLHQYPDARPAVSGRAPLLGQAPGQNAAGTPGAGSAAGTLAGQIAAAVGENLDPRAVAAIMQRAGGDAQAATAGAARSAGNAATGSAAASSGANSGPVMPPVPGSPAAILAAAGLPVPTGMAGQLATALWQALQGSGLFYESHLREFAFGQRTLAQMRTEPQAQAGQDTGRSGGAEAGQARGGAEAGGGSSAAQAAQAAQVAQSAQATQHLSTHLAGALLGLDPSTHALVRQQLETLANQSFAWHGEAWPGTDMEWEVQRREQQGGEGDEPETWSTRLKLQLPGMGEVVARLSLSNSQIIMHLVAPDGADLMSEHTDLLRQRLTLQGLQLSQLTIAREITEEPGAST